MSIFVRGVCFGLLGVVSTFAGTSKVQGFQDGPEQRPYLPNLMGWSWIMIKTLFRVRQVGAPMQLRGEASGSIADRIAGRRGGGARG